MDVISNFSTIISGNSGQGFFNNSLTIPIIGVSESKDTSEHSDVIESRFSSLTISERFSFGSFFGIVRIRPSVG